MLFESDIELPWPAGGGRGEPDVSVRRGAVPLELGSPADAFAYWQVAPSNFLINVPGVARCLVSEGGRRVRVAPEGGVRDAVVCIFDSVLAACLQMRGVLVLHASAVATAEGAVLFAGAVGVGKSTLAAALVDRGYRLLADGLVGVVADGGPPLALRGFPQVRLWKHAMDLLDDSWRLAEPSPVRSGIECYAAESRRFGEGRLPVRSVYFLSGTDGAEAAFKPLAPARAFASLVGNTCRARLLHGLGQGGGHFRAVDVVVRHAAVGRLLRPHHACLPAALAGQVADRLPPPA